MCMSEPLAQRVPRSESEPRAWRGTDTVERAERPESAVSSERAVYEECADWVERAVTFESAVVTERAVVAESAARLERAEVTDSAGLGERAMRWESSIEHERAEKSESAEKWERLVAETRFFPHKSKPPAMRSTSLAAVTGLTAAWSCNRRGSLATPFYCTPKSLSRGCAHAS